MNDFRLARPEDRADLEALSALPVPGRWIDLSYRRCFQDCREQVLLGRTQTGEMAALALRSLPLLWRRGTPQRLGYLGGLRVDPRFQGRNLLAEGFALLRRLHEADPVEEYLATIVEGNQLARRLLVERARPSWPRFFPSGVLCTLALETRAFPFQVVSAPDGQCQREYFPCETPEEAGERRWWVQHEGVIGCLRDLSRTRQTRVAGYHGALRWLRPLFNLWQKLWKRPLLPASGSLLKGGYAGFVCSDGYRPRAFEQWLPGMLGMARAQGMDWLYLGLCESDPYLPIARRFRHRLYRSQVFRVRYQGQPAPLNEGAPYLELAWL
ncbi:MAG: hypothetical protein KF760_28265 [Candidatus Eremiobacteraeota bacterium]|nr:hypothetical protein [Candidatus Eremiobacteraeota bacterium]MCW5865791.1 hypothetical protein [Candidatus Eremiobacteraeota bacterium]